MKKTKPVKRQNNLATLYRPNTDPEAALQSDSELVARLLFLREQGEAASHDVKKLTASDPAIQRNARRIAFMASVMDPSGESINMAFPCLGPPPSQETTADLLRRFRVLLDGALPANDSVHISCPQVAIPLTTALRATPDAWANWLSGQAVPDPDPSQPHILLVRIQASEQTLIALMDWEMAQEDEDFSEQLNAIWLPDTGPDEDPSISILPPTSISEALLIALEDLIDDAQLAIHQELGVDADEFTRVPNGVELVNGAEVLSFRVDCRTDDGEVSGFEFTMSCPVLADTILSAAAAPGEDWSDLIGSTAWRRDESEAPPPPPKRSLH